MAGDYGTMLELPRKHEITKSTQVLSCFVLFVVSWLP